MDADAVETLRRLKPDRFWLPVGASKEVIFVDDECIGIREHNFKRDDNWNNHLTCNADAYPDDGGECCRVLKRDPRWTGLYTVIDATGYIARGGETKGRGELKLFPATSAVVKKLARIKATHGGFAYAKLRVSRDDKSEAQCGETFEYLAPCPPEKVAALFAWATLRGKKLAAYWRDAMESPRGKDVLAHLWNPSWEDGKPVYGILPFNYMNLLRPMEPKVMKQFFRRNRPDAEEGGIVSSSKPGAAAGAQDDSPF